MKKILHKIYSRHHHHHHNPDDDGYNKKEKSKPYHSEIESEEPIYLDFLSSSYLEETNGFHLKSKDESPTSLEIKPTHGMGQVSVAISRWKMETSSFPSSAIFPHSSPLPWTKLTMSVALVETSKTGDNLGTDEVITFRQRTNRDSSYFPEGQQHGNGYKNSRFVDVYCSHKTDELLGWIKYGPDYHHHPSKFNLDDAWVINDLISKSVFLTSPLELVTEDLNFSSSPAEMTFGMRFTTTEDLTVAVLQTKRGMRQRRTGQVSWTDWKLQFTPAFSTSLHASAKSIILVASIIWVLNSKEQERSSRRALSIRQNSAE